MKQLRTYLVRRSPILGIAGICGALSTCGNVYTASSDAPGVTEALSESTKLIAGDFFWEPSRGWLLDFVLGRPLLFEARDPTDITGNRDIYRSFARLSYEGRLLNIGPARNLSATKSADEYGLRGHGRLAFFGTVGEETPPSISFLNLQGERRRGEYSLLERWQLGITRSLESGSWRGLGRSDLSLSMGEKQDSLAVVLQGERLRIQLRGRAVVINALSLFESPESDEILDAGLSLISREHKPSPFLHFTANTGRHLVGVGAVAWAEGRVFSLRDKLRRASYSVTHAEKAPLLPEAKPPQKTASPRTSEGLAPIWPPASIVQEEGARSGDGKWRAVRRALLPNKESPLFYQTLLHPDPKRPYAELHLVAMDMRRLRLGIGAGYEDPHPETGPPGSGHLPLNSDVTSRVVATFNGAFKAVHGRYGMKAEGRVLVDAIAGAATVTIDTFGRAGFGTWSDEMSANQTLAFRQNLDPLIAKSIVNPSGRSVWGEHLYGSGVAVERSALCLHQSGQILYGWATEATGSSLAEGMLKAGCVYALHLDMNPGHCAFLFNQVDSVSPLKARGETLDPRMQVNPTRFVRWSPKDFFYLSQRLNVPKDSDVVWQPAPGSRPEPQSVPGILQGRTTVGNLTISLDRINAGRLSFSLIPGSAESKPPLSLPASSNEEVEASLLAWGLGHRTPGTRTGLTDGERVLSPLLRSYASLVIDGQRIVLLPPGVPLRARENSQIVQLPLLANEGALLPAAKELGGKRERGALCIDQEGNFLVARMNHDTPAPLAQTLLALGCELVVAMDRGSHPPPFVQRAGTEDPPGSGREQTVLYARAAVMKPRTYTF